MEDKTEGREKPITEEIRRRTGGTFIGGMCRSTLLAWTPEYDDKGRPTGPNPNVFTSSVTIDGVEYTIKKKGFSVKITYLGKDMVEHDYDTLDITPDYIKELEKKDVPDIEKILRDHDE